MCEKEPIHIPGSIQENGLLIVVDETNFQIIQVSNNCKELIGVPFEEVLGNNLESILGQSQFDSLKSDIDKSPNTNDINPIGCSFTVENEIRAFDLTVHRSDNVLVLEFEPSVKRDGEASDRSFSQIQEAIKKIPLRDNTKQLFQEVADEVKRISKFDRVMAYKFHEDDHGEVIAESKEDDLESFLGLHYPASDIPPQARKLYEKNWFRIISDTFYTPRPLVPPLNPLTNKPLDLSGSVLRGVSPMHIAYLKNMGVRASMSISIMNGGKLWGLIACHNTQPKNLPYELRMACTFIGQMLSWQLVSLLENEIRKEFMERGNATNSVISSLSSSPNLMTGIEKEGPRISSLLKAQGVSLHFLNYYLQYGSALDLKEVKEIHQIVENEMNSRNQNVYSNRNFACLYPNSLKSSNIMSGIMAISIPGETNKIGSLIWYRQEEVHSVSWAGNPEKISDHLGMLHPRKSFAAWSEEVRNLCPKWTEVDNLVAENFRNLFLEIVVKLEVRQFRSLEALTKRQEEFVDTICHEIRNPINGILGSVEIIKEKLSRIRELAMAIPELAELEEHLDDIKECAIQQTTITTDALDLSRLDYQKFNVAPLSVGTVVRSAVKLFTNSASQKNIQFIVKDSPLFMKGDSQRLKQILINLLSNAIKFTDQGSISISYREEEKKETSSVVVIAVEDTGIGMTEEELGKLFGRFSQANDKISSKYGGSGLGLSICRKLARLMGGDIFVESKPNVGSTFLLKIPSQKLTRAEIESVDVLAVKPQSYGSNAGDAKMQKKILIVEDNLINQRILIAFLRRHNYDCILALNGKEAVEQFFVYSLELVGAFMDIEMPIMNGYESTKFIREKEKELHMLPIPIIGLSGNAREEQKQQALSAGMNDYVTKPISEEVIAQKIRMWFQR